VSESQEKMDNDNDVWSLQVSNNQKHESSVQDSETSPFVVLGCDVIPMHSEYDQNPEAYIESDQICRRIGTLGGQWPSSFKLKNQPKLGLTSGTKRFPQMMRKRPKQKQESTEVGIDFLYAKFPRMMRKRPKQKQVCSVRLRRSKKF